MEQSVKQEGKTMAIICYITIIGLAIAWIMNKDKNNAFAKFHIGQSIRITILAIAINIIVRAIDFTFLSFLSFVPIVLFILGILNAINLKNEPVPVIGTIGG